MVEFDPELPGWAIDAAAAQMGRAVVGVRRPRESEGGWSPAVRRILEFDDGTTAFLKFGGGRRARADVRHESTLYDAIDAPFMIRKLGGFDAPAGVGLLLADHDAATWPPPWSDAEIGAMIEVLDALRRTPPPPVVAARSTAAARFDGEGWTSVAADPEPLISRGVVAPVWLERHLDHLVAMSPASVLDGDTLVHLDLRSDNICFVDGTPRVIDWASARLGHRYLDQHYWATTLHHETGTRHDELLRDDAPAHLVFLAGIYAAVASASPIDAAGVDRSRRAEDALRALLPWMCDLLRIDHPTPAGDGAEPG